MLFKETKMFYVEWGVFLLTFYRLISTYFNVVYYEKMFDEKLLNIPSHL